MSRSLSQATLVYSSAIVLGMGLSLATSVWAGGPPIKPGIWEITTDSRTVNGQVMPDMSAKMAEQMQQMPPDMRAKMQAQMKAHGVQMAPASNGQLGVRMCITREMLDQNQWQQTDGLCQNTSQSQSGSKWSWTFKCQQPPSEGQGNTTFNGTDAYVSDIHMRSHLNGQPVVIDMKHHGKWLGADCKDLQPLRPAAPKP